ncbi:MAG: 3-oxoacyl-ACP synthase, partial [Flavobacteriia bacterium]
MGKIKIKKALFKACTDEVALKTETISKIMQSNKKALESETKSSAGDKHEIGRAVLQLEMEKASQQITAVKKMLETLKRISVNNIQNTVASGSVVRTSGFDFYISVSLGEIVVDRSKYYAISARSPIGNLLMGKKA